MKYMEVNGGCIIRMVPHARGINYGPSGRTTELEETAQARRAQNERSALVQAQRLIKSMNRKSGAALQHASSQRPRLAHQCNACTWPRETAVCAGWCMHLAARGGRGSSRRGILPRWNSLLYSPAFYACWQGFWTSLGHWKCSRRSCA